MARFRYRMQNILGVKQKLETQAKNEFAIQSARVREEEERLAAFEKRREDYRLLYRKLQEGDLDFAKIKEAADAVESMKYVIERQKIQLMHENKILDEKREALSEAMKDVKTHEKLKERQFEVFLADEAAKESKEIDELVSYRFTKE